MAKLPHPAVVITTLDRTYQAQAAAGVPLEAMQHPIARGITASSFTSLCVRPSPHVMFNMSLPSTMYDALVACRDFNVHLLTPDACGARVAAVFTRGNRMALQPQGEEYAFDIDADLGVFVGLKDERLRHVEIANRDAWHEQYQKAKESASESVQGMVPGSEGAGPMRQVHHVPCLQSKGVMEVLNCRLVRTIHPDLPNAGQNVVIIGEVVDVTFPKGSDEDSDKMPVALGYADRQYRSIGGVIHPNKVTV
jgi:flavin reductase (DIM6/NTAB) family NADH-FMN oxidoreductase RutF